MHAPAILALAALWVLIPLRGLAQDPPQPGPAGDPPALPWVTRQVEVPRVSFHRFHSQAARSEVSYHLYTPLAYDSSPTTRFPVLYWLHGTEGGVNHIRPVARLFHVAIRDHGVPPMLVVFVNGLSQRLWTDSRDGRAPIETVFIKELIPHIDQAHRTIAQPEGRILEGFSMGGYGAARIGFRHPDLFGGISILAGGPLDPEFQGPRATGNPLREKILAQVCDGDLKYFQATHPWTLAETHAQALRERGTVIRQAVGSRDFTLDLNRRFHDRLESLKIPHEFTVVEGVAHDTPTLLAGLKNARFYQQALTPRASPPKADTTDDLSPK